MADSAPRAARVRRPQARGPMELPMLSLDRLRRMHARLETELDAERTRFRPDDTRVARLKKVKLAVKDRMAKQVAQPIQMSA
jgi:hypothetical protein